MKDSTYFFEHDYNAQSDPKIQKMLAAHGLEAYGTFWAILERLYQQDGKLPLDFETLAFSIRGEAKLVKAVVSDFELFYLRDASFGSRSVDKRLTDRKERSERARSSGLASAAVRRGSTHVQRTFNDAQLKRNGTEGNGREPTAVVSLEEVIGTSTLTEKERTLLSLRYPIRGAYHNRRIADLAADYAGWALEHLTDAGPELRAALRARVKLKAEESKR